MVAYTKPQQRKEEKTETLRGEREIRSNLLILELKDGKLQDSGKPSQTWEQCSKKDGFGTCT